MHSFILPVVGIVVVLVILAVLKKLPKGKGLDLPYEKEDFLFTPAERSFLGVLKDAVGTEFRIMGKVRIGDIVKVKAGVDAKTRTSAFNRIQSKHIDFVACNPQDLSVQFVIELDDSSHSRQDRQDRDAFVDKVMGAAGIPIIHFPVKRTYSIQEVRDTLVSKLNQPESSPAPKATSTPAVPYKATPKFASVATPTPVPASAAIAKPSLVPASPVANDVNR